MIWYIVSYVSITNLLITLCLNIAWILVCMRKCCRTVNRYLTCKRTPDLHPIYKDVQYLSRQRKLYNLETHIVKYVLVILCMSVEVVGLVCAGVFVIVINIEPNGLMFAEMMKNQEKYPNCHFEYRLWNLYSFPLLIWFQNLTLLTGLLWFVLVCPDIHSHQISSS